MPPAPDLLPGRLVLLGCPVAHSLSPAMQNAALAAARIPLTYEALDVEPKHLAAVLMQARAGRWSGNVTIPHKPAVAAACDRLTDVARRAGAVNTFWVRDGVLHGDNTDVPGFTAAARALLGREPADLTVGLFGAGGAARGVLTAVESWPGSRVMLANRTAARADALGAEFGSVVQGGDADDIARKADLVVNATSIGLDDDDYPIDPRRLRPDAAVLDLVYRRGTTAFVRRAREHGLRAADGLAMLVEQGAVAFERWLGRAPDRQVMWKAITPDRWATERGSA